jgi:hypothetical protein
MDLPKEAGIIMQEYNIMMNILGLRNLQSSGILPVKKASIHFNLKSMVSPDVGNAIENIKTEPSVPGPDPTLSTLIEADIALPTEKLYTPRMACRVNDNIMGGFNQPIIGTFTLPIGDLIESLAKERKEEIEAIEDVVEELRKYANGEKLAISMRNNLKKNDDMNAAMDSDLSML